MMMLIDAVVTVLAIAGGLFLGQLAIDWWRNQN